jgi:hypothetical protein
VEFYAERTSELDRIFGEPVVTASRTETGAGAAQ